MNEKQRLIEEIEQAPDFLITEVLNFLLFTKSRAREIARARNTDWETQLQEMACDREIKAEIEDINNELFLGL